MRSAKYDNKIVLLRVLAKLFIIAILIYISNQAKKQDKPMGNYIIGIKTESNYFQKSVSSKTEKGALKSAEKIANELFYGEKVEITARKAVSPY